jgi:solute carrier family 10 (sodium/bile acid cotransporter), member 7
LALIDAVLLSTALLIMTSLSRTLAFDRADESAIVFCGSQKSIVSGIPIANALIGGPALGLFLLPVMIYHSMQLLVCAWLAKRYAQHADSPPRRQVPQLPSRPDLRAAAARMGVLGLPPLPRGNRVGSYRDP